jgi:beta-lactam-binding protein with PASTA domain
MLGIGGKFSSSPGMVRVPDLSGKNLQQSVEILTNLKIPLSQLPATETQDSNLGGLLESQSIAAGTLVDYGSIVVIRFFIYVAPPPPPPPPPAPTPVVPDPEPVTLLYTVEGTCENSSFSVSTTCSGTTSVVTNTTTASRVDTYYYSDGTTATGTVDCSSSSTTEDACGCPPSNCSTVVSSGNYLVDNSKCASGRAWYRRDFHPACCDPSFSDSYGGCIPK